MKLRGSNSFDGNLRGETQQLVSRAATNRLDLHQGLLCIRSSRGLSYEGVGGTVDCLKCFLSSRAREGVGDGGSKLND
jgi:hypothetical protein